jgi:hypothetical protein
VEDRREKTRSRGVVEWNAGFDCQGEAAKTEPTAKPSRPERVRLPGRNRRLEVDRDSSIHIAEDLW